MDIINIGQDVICDFCNSDGEESNGGVLIGTSAVCGLCCKQYGYDKDDYEHKGDIAEIFPKSKTFKENVLEYRLRTTGSKNGEIIIRSI